MGYFKELYEKPVQKPTNQVAVIDRKYICQEPKQFILERAKSSFAKYNLKVKGADGVKYYKGKCTEFIFDIYNLKNTRLLRIQESSQKEIRKDIYVGKDKKNPISRIKSRHSKSNYKLIIDNLIIGDTETLEMNSDRKLVVCGIFYGNEKEGAPLIAKITRDKKIRTKCTLDIAPGVDIIYMIGLAAFFSNGFKYINRRRKRRDSDLSLDSLLSDLIDDIDGNDDGNDNGNDDGNDDGNDNGNDDGNDYSNAGYNYGNDDGDYAGYGFNYGDCNPDSGGWGGGGGDGWGGDGWGGDGWGGDCGGGDGGGGGGD